MEDDVVEVSVHVFWRQMFFCTLLALIKKTSVRSKKFFNLEKTTRFLISQHDGNFQPNHYKKRLMLSLLFKKSKPHIQLLTVLGSFFWSVPNMAFPVNNLDTGFSSRFAVYHLLPSRCDIPLNLSCCIMTFY